MRARRHAARSTRDGVRDGAVCGTGRSTRNGEISLFCTLGQIKSDFWQDTIILYPRTGCSARFRYIKSKSCQKQRPGSTFQRNFARIAHFPCASVHNSETSPCQSNLFRANGYELPVFCVKPFSQASRRRLTAFVRTLKRTAAPKSRCLSN